MLDAAKVNAMPDLEKVIKGLECCTADLGIYHQDHFCSMCPYKNHDPEITFCFNKVDLMRDALEALKAQEPIPCGEKIKAGDVVLDFYECGYCKNAIRKPWRYCPFCGKAVKWR